MTLSQGSLAGAVPHGVSAAETARRFGGGIPLLTETREGEGIGFWLVVSGLILSCLAGHWSNIGVPLPIDRALLLVGLAVEWNRAPARRTGPNVSAAPAMFLVAATAWAVCSFLGAASRDADGIFFLLDLYVIPALLFVSAPIVFSSDRRRFLLAAAFTCFGIYLGFTAITQTLGLSSLVFPSYILDPSVGIHADRARGPYVEASNNGLMLIFSGAFGAFLVLAGRRRAWQAAGMICVGLTVVGCALTLTRAVWFASAAAIVVAVVAVPALRRRLPALLLTLLALTAGFLTAFPGFLVAATARGGDESPIWDRLNVNAGAVRMLLQDPLFGVGWNQAGPRMTEFIRLGPDYPVTAASAGLIPHNLFLTRYAELGLLGGTLWLVAILVTVVMPIFQRAHVGFGAWRVTLGAFTASYVVIGNFGPLNYSEPAYLLFLVAGITAMGRRAVPTPHDWRPRRAEEVRAG